jgi:hypothetical protein
MAPRKKNTEHVETQTRMQTRAANSSKHPGTEALAALKVHRNPALVAKEKEEKKARKDAKEHTIA